MAWKLPGMGDDREVTLEMIEPFIEMLKNDAKLSDGMLEIFIDNVAPEIGDNGLTAKQKGAWKKRLGLK